MSRKWLRSALTLLYIVLLVLNASGLIQPEAAPRAYAGEEAAAQPAEIPERPSGATPPAVCPNDSGNRLSVQLWELHTVSTIFGNRNILHNDFYPGGFTGSLIQVTPGDLVRIVVRVTNTAAVDATGVQGNVRMDWNNALNRVDIDPIWTDLSGNPITFDGILSPGEVAQAYVEYTARASDPVVMDYRWNAWGTFPSIGVVCDQDTGSTNNLTFRVDGPNISVDLTASAAVEVGDTITWTLTVVNNRAIATTLNFINDVYFETSTFGACTPTPGSTIEGLMSTLSLPASIGALATGNFSCTMRPEYPNPVLNSVVVQAQASGITAVFGDSATTTKAIPSLRVLKYANVQQAAVGETITYTIRIENNGDVPLNNVTVVDSLTGIITGVPNPLPAGDIVTRTVNYTVKESDADPLINIVTAVGVSPRGTNVGDNWTASVDKTNPALELVMTVTPNRQLPNNTVQYGFQVNNTGPDGLVNVTLTFPLCTLPGAGVGCTGGQVNLTSTSIPAGGSVSGSFVYTIQPSDPDPFGYTTRTTATVRATTTTGSIISDSASVFVDILDDRLQITKTADRTSALRGDTITYDIAVTNLTPDQDFVIQSINDSLVGQVGGIPPTGLSLPAGTTYSFSVPYTVAGSDPDPLVNVIEVLTTTPGLSDSTSEIVDISDAQLFITVSSNPPDEQGPGLPVLYNVGIANIGRITLTDIVGYWEVVSGGGAPTQLQINFGSGPTTVPDDLAPFESAFAEFTRTVQSSDPDPLTILVRITGRDDQGLERSFFGTATINVLPTQIRLTKTANVNNAAVGDTINYEFVIENISDEIIDGVTLSDALCPTTSTDCLNGHVLIAPYDGTAVTGPYAETLSLAPADPIAGTPGGMAYGKFSYQVTLTDLTRRNSTITNTATVTGTRRVSGDRVADSNQWNVQVVNPLTIDKAANRVVATRGQCITYTYTITNTGQLSTITNLTLQDSNLGTIGTQASLPPRAVWVVTAPTTPCGAGTGYEVDNDDVTRGAISNAATVTGTVNNQLVSAVDTWEVDVTEPIIVTKSAYGIALIGDEVTYQISVSNVSDSPYTLVSAIDQSNSAGTPGPRDFLATLIAGSSGTADNVLQPGETATMTYSYIVQPRDPNELNNTFTVTVNDGTGNVPYSAASTVEIFSPFLILKTPTPTFALVGQTVHYDYTVWNISRVSMENVVLTDDKLGAIAVRYNGAGVYTTSPQSLPAAISNPADSPCLPFICNPNYLQSDPAGNNYVIKPADLASETLVNTVTVRGVTGAGPVEQGVIILTEDDAEVQVSSPLQVIKTGPASANIGDTINYTITLTNTSLTDTIRNITAVDTLTGEVTLTFPNPANPGQLAPGQTAVGTASLVVPPTASDPFTNIVTANGVMTIGGVDYNLVVQGQAEVDLLNPILAVDLTSDVTEAERGHPINWTVVLRNNGTTTINGLTYDDSTNAIIASLASCPTSLLAGQTASCSWQYTVGTSDPDPLVNTLTVQGTDTGGQSLTASDNAIVDIIDPRFRVSKVADPGIGFVGSTITYTITVTNSSGSIMDSVAATDDLTGPVPLVFPSGVSGRLNPNESAVGVITYTLSQADPSPLFNRVSASGRTIPAGLQLSDSTYTTVLISSSQLLVEKQASPSVVQVGNTITYNIAITNIGQTRIRNLRVVDAAVGLDTSASPNTCGGPVDANGDGSTDYTLTCTVTNPLTVSPAEELRPFQVAFISYRVVASATIPDPFVNEVRVTGLDSSDKPVEGIDRVAVDIAVPGILLTKTADRSGASVNDTIQYTIELVNVGASPLTGIQVVDNVTGQLVPMSYNGGAATTDPALSSLAAGRTARGVVFYVVTRTTPNPFVNTVTVTNDQGLTDGAAATVEIRDLSLTVTKRADVTSALIGDTITYTIEVTNTSSTALTAVMALDQLSGLPVPLHSPTSGLEITSLAVGERAVGTFLYTVPPTVPDPLINRVTVSGRAPSGVVVSTSALAVVDIREADISLSKIAINGAQSGDSITAAVGDTITYQFTIANAGTSNLSNVQVSDPLCATALTGCTGGLVNFIFPGQSVPATTGTLGPNESVTGSITRVIQTSDPDPLVNTARATARTISGVLIQDADSATVQISASALVVTKTIRGIGTCASAVPATSAEIGDTLAYDIEVRNLSASTTIMNVAVQDALTGNYIPFSTFTTPITPGPGTTGPLGPSGFAQACITATVPAGATSPFVNTAVATGQIGGLPVMDTSSASIPLTTSDLLVTNTPDRSFASIGDTVTFTVTIRNTGLTTITSLAASSLPTGSALPLSVTTLAPGQSTIASYTHTISGMDADPYRTTANVTGLSQSRTITGAATASVDIVSPNIRIVKSATPTLATVGTPINYTIAVTNTGTTNIESVTITDTLLGGNITSRFPAVSAAQPLIPGATISATLSRTVTSADGDPAVNTAAVTAVTATGATLTDTSTAQVNIAGSGLQVIKRASVAAAQNGDVITYTVEITNTSTTRVSGLTISDSLTSGLTLPQYSLDPGQRISTSYTHTVNTSTDLDPLINTVAVAGRDQLGVAVSDTSSATVALLSNANLRVILTADRARVLATEPINYLATVTNIGAETLNNITLVATRPDGSTLSLITLADTISLGSGQSVTRTFSYTVQPADVSPITTTVTATGIGAIAGTVTDTSSVRTGLTASSIDIDLRTANCAVPCVAVVGDLVTFAATVTNSGATLLTGLSMTSPQAVTSANPTGQLITGAPPIIQPGESHTVTFAYRVPLGVPPQTLVSVTASAQDPVGATVMQTFDLILSTATPRISVVLTADKTQAANGDTVTYTATITNVGNTTIYNVALVDSRYGSIVVSPAILSLTPNAARQVTFTHVITASDPDPLVNTLTVSATTSFNRSVADNDTFSINVRRPELFVTVAADRSIATVGELINYQITVLNIGDGPVRTLRAVYITATPTQSAGTQQRPSLQGGSIQLTLPADGTLAEGVGTTGTFNHVVTSADANPLTFRVTATGEGLVGTTQVTVSDDALISTPLITVDSSGNPIVVGTPIPGTAAPEVTKTADLAYAIPGGLLTWQVSVRNPGTDPLSGIIVTDTLESTMVLQSVTINNGTIESEGNVIVATTGTLTFNQSAVLTVIARVREDVLANQVLQNIGCATSIGAQQATCATGTVRVSPDASMLPATGAADVAPGQPDFPIGALMIGLLALTGLLGLALNVQDKGLRLVIIVALVAAAVVIVAVVASLVLNLGSAPVGTPQAAAATATPPEATSAPLETALPTSTPEPGQPTAPPPTPIPIPTAIAALPPGQRVPVETVSQPPFSPQYDRELYIPKLGLSDSVPIVTVPLRNQTWDVRDLGQSIGFLEGTTWVEEAGQGLGGNTVLAGHIQITTGVPGPFRDLDLLEVGDSIFLAERGRIYEFMVYAIDVVAPDDVEVTYPTRNQTLTLITCTTWDAFRGIFEERLAIRAVPVRIMDIQAGA